MHQEVLADKLLLTSREMDIQVCSTSYFSFDSDSYLGTAYPVVVAAKSISDASTVKPFPPDPDSQESTISTVVREIREAGGDAFAIAVDVRDFDSVTKMVNDTVNVGLFVETRLLLEILTLTLTEIRSSRRINLQPRSHLVGLGPRHSYEALSAHAKGQPRRSLRDNPGCLASFQSQRLERSYHRRQPPDLLSVLPW